MHHPAGHSGVAGDMTSSNPASPQQKSVHLLHQHRLTAPA
jgi:hypothetical protein